MTTIKSVYSSATSITCTFNSLASSSTVGRESTAVDNTTNLYLDALVFCRVSFPNSAPANDKAVYLYAYGYDGSSLYTGGVTGSDAGYTRKDPTTLRLLGVVPIPTQNVDYYAGPFSVAAAFGGLLPSKWGIVVINYAGQTLNASNNTLSYVGVHAQSV